MPTRPAPIPPVASRESRWRHRETPLAATCLPLSGSMAEGHLSHRRGIRPRSPRCPLATSWRSGGSRGGGRGGGRGGSSNVVVVVVAIVDGARSPVDHNGRGDGGCCCSVGGSGLGGSLDGGGGSGGVGGCESSTSAGDQTSDIRLAGASRSINRSERFSLVSNRRIVGYL